MNVFIDIDIDIDIFKSDLIDIDNDIDIFKKCRYIDNRYGLSIYRTPLVLIKKLNWEPVVVLASPPQSWSWLQRIQKEMLLQELG